MRASHRTPPTVAPGLTRRSGLTGLVAGALLLSVRPARATPVEMAMAIGRWTGGAPVTAGRVRLDVARLVDNGNAVPVTITVDTPPGTPAVRALALFNERNPQTEVAEFLLGPAIGRAEVSTRIRMATSQRLVALARLEDGSHWSGAADVIVTLAACIEGDP